MGSLFDSASKGDLVLRFGPSDSKMEGVLMGVVRSAGWVGRPFLVLSARLPM